jgi:hypothetical protein
MQEHGDFGPFPPVVLFHDTAGQLWLSAGFHREAAARLASQRLIQEGQPGIEALKAEIRPGEFEDAYWFAITDNLSNGLQMSNQDQKEALRRLLGLDVPVAEAEAYVTMSNRQLAAIIGVSYKTIGRWRKELEDAAPGTHVPPDNTLRQGADGKVYNVSNIQAANRERVDDTSIQEETPLASPAITSEPLRMPSNSPPEPIRHRDGVDPPDQWNDAPVDWDIEVDSTPRENVPLDADVQQLATVLQNLIDAAPILKQTSVAWLEHLTPDQLDVLAELIGQAFEDTNGYEIRPKQWVHGGLDYLEQLYQRLYPNGWRGRQS